MHAKIRCIIFRSPAHCNRVGALNDVASSPLLVPCRERDIHSRKHIQTKLTVALLTLLCGCSNTATISLINGRTFEARIARSDAKSIIVTTAGGPEVVIPRADIAEIDHPGNGTAVFGGLLSAYGILNIAAGMKTCGDVGAAACVGTALPAAIGLPLLIWGLTTRAGSTGAANNSTGGYTDTGAVPAPSSTAPVDSWPRSVSAE